MKIKANPPGIWILIIGILLHTGAFAQNFNVSLIPAELIKDANAVVRLDEQNFEIIHDGKIVEKNRFVVTVLNEKGADWADYQETYNRFHKIHSIEGYLYDAGGKQISKMKTKDAIDLSGNDGTSLIEDTRVKVFSFRHREYPYTVDFTTELEKTSTLFFPAWYAQPGELISVQQSCVTVTSPPDYTYRYRAYNYPGEPERKVSGKSVVTKWEVKNLSAYKREPFSPMAHEYTTLVIFGPSSFRIDDYRGDMSSWESLGKFMYDLNNGRDILPPDIKARVHQLTDHLPGVEEKIRVLYQFLQKNTRYISIQLGVGGWQTFDAKFVASKAYGDCKALTNYMYSLLKEAGIPSHYALVRAGAGATYLNTDFPSSQFNHVILCVPLKQDTTWLECTSQSFSAGYIGDFTNDRPALLVRKEGGQLVMTKRYPAESNQQIRKIQATLFDDGSMQVQTVTRYSGLQMDNVHGMINNLGKDKIREYLQSRLDLATYDVTKFDYQEEKAGEPAVHENLEIQATGYASFSGKRLFIVPNVMNRSQTRLSENKERKHDLVLSMGFLDVDSVVIRIPGGYKVELAPPDTKISNDFGEYSSSVKFESAQITYYRRFLFKGGRHAASKFNEYVDFREKIQKADRARMVLVKE